MKRIHSFEFEDLEWFPQTLRNYVTDYLQFSANALDIYKPIIPILQKGITAAGNNTIIDIASGGGGGYIKLGGHLAEQNPDLKIMLSDFYPNLDAFKATKAKLPDTIDYIATPVNAMSVPSSWKGLRTQFLSLHHFRPEQARAILQNAVDNKQPIAIFEGQQRNVASIISILFAPLFLFLFTPFIRPFRFTRLLFTYILPVLPLVVLWDGIISVLRTYTQDELNAMIASLDNTESFEWETGIVKGKGPIPYLLGLPRQ